METTYQFWAGLHFANEHSGRHEYIDGMLLALYLHARKLFELHGMLRRAVCVADVHKHRNHRASTYHSLAD